MRKDVYMGNFQEIFSRIKEILEVPLFKLGVTRLTLWNLIYLIVLTLLLFYISGMIRKWVAEKLLTRTRIDLGARQAAGSIVRYAVIAVGFVIILQNAGIDLTALNVMAGAIGIGLGFGLQNIVNNFISGLIILFERPIKVGDRIVVGDIEGNVEHIGGRSTTVVTNDNITIIVPNSKFITENVINWSHSGSLVRFRIAVSVAYGSNVDLVDQLLLETAGECPDVLANPPPGVRLMAFGDSGLDFELRAWSTSLIHRRGLLTSKLNLAIYRKFEEHGVEIPYPRRDLTIRGVADSVHDPK